MAHLGVTRPPDTHVAADLERGPVGSHGRDARWEGSFCKKNRTKFNFFAHLRCNKFTFATHSDASISFVIASCRLLFHSTGALCHTIANPIVTICYIFISRRLFARRSDRIGSDRSPARQCNHRERLKNRIVRPKSEKKRSSRFRFFRCSWAIHSSRKTSLDFFSDGQQTPARREARNHRSEDAKVLGPPPCGPQRTGRADQRDARGTAHRDRNPPNPRRPVLLCATQRPRSANDKTATMTRHPELRDPRPDPSDDRSRKLARSLVEWH